MKNFQRLITMKISSRRKVLGILFSAVVLVLVLSVLTPGLVAKNKPITTTPGANENTFVPLNTYGYGYGYGCAPHTPGYWRNHPEAWPVDDITIGGITYSMDEAIALIFHPTQGDKTYNMFEHLVAAKLNVLMGCDSSCIAEVIEDADDWMAIHPVGSDVDGDSDAWDEGEPLLMMLDDYNNGFLCW